MLSPNNISPSKNLRMNRHRKPTDSRADRCSWRWAKRSRFCCLRSTSSVSITWLRCIMNITNSRSCATAMNGDEQLKKLYHNNVFCRVDQRKTADVAVIKCRKHTNSMINNKLQCNAMWWKHEKHRRQSYSERSKEKDASQKSEATCPCFWPKR